MKTKYLNLYLVATLCCTLSLFSNAESFNANALENWLTKTHQRHNLAGLTAVIVKDGQTIFNHSFGVTDINAKTDMTTEHLFDMASMGKTAITVAILQLVEQGKINLDAPVIQYLPYFKMDDERAAQITIKQLLTHTSGIPNPKDYGYQNPQTDDLALERWVKQQSDRKLKFTPGKEWAYSDIAFEIVGDVIAKTSGMTFEAYMKANIFAPLGMISSTFLLADIPKNLRVTPHSQNKNGTHALDFYPYNRRHAPSSAYHTNGNDMAKWLTAFSSEERLRKTGLLKAESIKNMWSVHYSDNDEDEMLLGWFKMNGKERTLYGHSGSDKGFVSTMSVYADRDAGYGLMINTKYKKMPLTEIEQALQLAIESKPSPVIPEITSK